MGRWMRHAADFPAFDRIGPRDTVVDIGCGVGRSSVAAGMAGARVISIDADPEPMAYLVDKMKEVPARSFRGLVSDCDPIPVADRVASFVVCTEVMEHVDHVCRFAAELNRIAKAGATYIITVPDPASEALIESVTHPSYFEPPNHQRVFAHGALDALLEAAGIDVLERPSTPNNFYWTMWCALRYASGVDGLPEPHSVPPIIYHWNDVWTTLLELPGGAQLADRLDAVVPRSQAVIARKSRRRVSLPAIEDAWRRLDRSVAGPRVRVDAPAHAYRPAGLFRAQRPAGAPARR